MSEIRNLRESIGLRQYADALEANDIDMHLLKQVDDQRLKDIGVASCSSAAQTKYDRQISSAVSR